MRIAFIGQKGVFLSKGGGGVEKHVAEIATRLVELGHDVTVYAQKKYFDRYPKYINGVSVRYVSAIEIMFRKVDVVHYHGIESLKFAWLLKLVRPRVTIIATLHGSDTESTRLGFLSGLVARKVANSIISVSHALQTEARDAYGVESVFIPNGAVIAQHRSQKALIEFDLKKNEYILTVGRILPVKGLHHLIKAFRRSKTKKKLAIVGDAVGHEDYLGELENLAKGDARILFLGRQVGDVKNQLMTHAYFFVQPSEREGLPIAVIEAMGNGSAVLVSEIPGNVEVIHRAGFTFENKNVDDLAQQLEHLFKHPEDIARARRDVKKIVEKHFNWDTITEQTLNVYRSARH